MRKSNSNFKTAFISEAGDELQNNNYFAFVELDNFACYVLAAGITDFQISDAAKEAVEHLILSFQEKPSMAKSTLMNYMKETNERLLNANSNYPLKASVLMVVTDYEKFRYVLAGNIRLRFYRNTRFFMKSKDMSLAQDLTDSGESDTPLDKHEERHNLYTFLGKQDFFHPYVSPKTKLMDADIFAIYSAGFWEHVDSAEIDEIFTEASDDPKDSLDQLEDLLLSRQPKNLKSYTFVAIFVDKAYLDPERERKRLRYIKIAIITLVVLLLIGLIIFIVRTWHRIKVEDYENLRARLETYIEQTNFVRAQSIVSDTIKQAESLGRKNDVELLKNYAIVIDGIIKGDQLIQEKQYDDAIEIFTSIQRNSQKADLVAMDYIQLRMKRSEEYLNISDFILLGDKALQAGELNDAEYFYFQARDKATAYKDDQSRQAAMAAIEKLYDQKTKNQQDLDEKLKDRNANAVSDAMKRGDDLMQAGDLEGAEKAYLQARAIAGSGDNREGRSDANEALDKIHVALDEVHKEKIEELRKSVEADEKLRKEYETELSMATTAMTKGDESVNTGDFASAAVYYKSAIDKFSMLSLSDQAEIASQKMQMALDKVHDSLKQREDAANAERLANEYYIERDFVKAKQYAARARQMYKNLENKDKVDALTELIQQIDADIAINKELRN